MVAALYVQSDGCYQGLDGVDPWDEARDAREYQGPHPVIAHPPCNRWCMPLAKVNETRYGHRVGGDKGMFAHALWAVRTFGGVLEHPAHTAAWKFFGLPKPTAKGVWFPTECGGHVCQIAQSAYGHKARKRTWLYVHGVELPELRADEPAPVAVTSWLQKTSTTLPRITKAEACKTPLPFRDLLLSIASTATEHSSTNPQEEPSE